MVLLLLGVATVTNQNVDDPIDENFLDEWSNGTYCAGLFDGTVPEFDTVSVGRYNTSELPI